ncbi:hypothetical protein [Variovorax sp. H27-G14]|uniref:hypothetical protein n=1 Tax=Variovorax sp. H27-G14 TaxID=3111914 RepID=UPI0038FD0006
MSSIEKSTSAHSQPSISEMRTFANATSWLISDELQHCVKCLVLAEAGWPAVVNARRRNGYAARCRQQSNSRRASEAVSRIQSKVARKGLGDGGKEQEDWFL